MRQPWAKFYYSDWRSDPKLRMCGLAARGLWMEMLALMHEATPYGHLLISGQSPTDIQLAALVGAPSTQIPDLLGELESVGVFSRTGKGVIYSRRMTREEKRAAQSRKNGELGGNPSLTKQKTIPPPDNPRLNGQDKTQRLEARGQIDTKEVIETLGKIVRGRTSRVDYSDPANRKARWQQKMFEEVRRRLPDKNAEIIIAGYLAGEQEAVEFIEQVDASVKARKASTTQ